MSLQMSSSQQSFDSYQLALAHWSMFWQNEVHFSVREDPEANQLSFCSSAEASRVIEKPYRGKVPAWSASFRLSQWEVMLLLKLVARSMGAATAQSLHAFMEASGRGYVLHTLDTFNILLQAWASTSAPDLTSAAFEACLQLLDRCLPTLSRTPATCFTCLTFCPARASGV